MNSTSDDDFERLESSLASLRDVLDPPSKGDTDPELTRLERAASGFRALADAQAALAHLKLQAEIDRLQHRAGQQVEDAENSRLRAQVDATTRESGARISALEAELDALRQLDPFAALHHYRYRIEQAGPRARQPDPRLPGSSPDGEVDEAGHARLEAEKRVHAALLAAVIHSREEAKRELEMCTRLQRRALKAIRSLSPEVLAGALVAVTQDCTKCREFLTTQPPASIDIEDARRAVLRPFPHAAMILSFGSAEARVHDCGICYEHVTAEDEVLQRPEALRVHFTRDLCNPTLRDA
jgi:hypothetical protein